MGNALKSISNNSAQRRYSPQEIERFLAVSDRLELEFRLRLDYWHMGFTHGEAVHEDDYERGFTDGIRAYKMAQKDRLADLQRFLADGCALGLWENPELEEKRWGPGGRAHFADPRPGEYQGGPVDW